MADIYISIKHNYITLKYIHTEGNTLTKYKSSFNLVGHGGNKKSIHKYTIIYDPKNNIQLTKKIHYEKIFSKFNIKPTDKHEQYDAYDIMIYLKQIPLNYGKYTVIKSPFKQKIQNDRNAYIGSVPIIGFLGYKHILNLDKFSWYPFSVVLNNRSDAVNFNKYPYWIIKPSLGSQGKDIVITSNENIDIALNKYENKSYPLIVQQYITNVLLVNKRKFDFRIYVLYIDAKIYINKYFDVRFAKEPYKNNHTNLFAGLTNFSQHKMLEYLVKGEDFMKMY